jgi:hypothetical protein
LTFKDGKRKRGKYEKKDEEVIELINVDGNI